MVDSFDSIPDFEDGFLYADFIVKNNFEKPFGIRCHAQNSMIRMDSKFGCLSRKWYFVCVNTN